MATASVLSGLDNGVKFLSQVAFVSGLVLLVSVFWLDGPAYLINVMLQVFGAYLQDFIGMSWTTDAFAQLKFGNGKVIGGSGAAANWMNGWTVFYWGWWISWSPFVGIFLARISKGRTIREVINWTWSVPVMFGLIWFCTFGGAGIKMHRRADFLKDAGMQISSNPNQFLDTSIVAGNCYTVPETLVCPDKLKDTLTGVCPDWIVNYEGNVDLSPVCMYQSSDNDGFWFDVMNQYYGLGSVLGYISIFTIGIYFVTSSDSGSLVVDLVASNGEEAHAAQRVYWALTEGGLAASLLLAGGVDGIAALQSMSICSGVPFTVAICLICLSLWKTLQYDQGLISSNATNAWALPLYTGIFDIIEFIFSGGSSPMPDRKHVLGFLGCCVFPPFYMYQTLERINSESAVTVGVAASITWTGFVVCGILSWFIGAFGGFAAFSYLAFVVCMIMVRAEVRDVYTSDGGTFEDLLISFFLHGQALWQVCVQVGEPMPDEKFTLEAIEAGAIATSSAKQPMLADNGLELQKVP